MEYYRVKTIFVRIFRQIRRDRRTMGLMVVAPVLVTFLYAYAFAGEIGNVPIAIANNDEQFQYIFSDLIINKMMENDSFSIREIDNITEAWSDFGNETQAIILFPRLFTKNLIIGENNTLQVWINVSMQYFSLKISELISSSLSDVLTEYFGNSGITVDYNVTIQQQIPLPPGLEDQIINISVINQDEGFNVSIGELIVDKLVRDCNVSVTIVDTKDLCRDYVEEEKSIVGVWIPSDFTENVLLRNSSIIELFINGIERDDMSVALQSIQNAISDSISEITNRTVWEINKNYVYGSEKFIMTDYMGPSVMGFIAMFFSFIISGVFFLRERLQGTLERMLASPSTKSEIIIGYIAAFTTVGIIQSFLVVLTMLYFSTQILSNLLMIIILVILLTVGSVSLAMFIASYMKTELQVIQMIPIYIVPQIFLSGMVVSLRVLPEFLLPLAYIFPLTYYISAVKALTFMNATINDVLLEFIILFAYFILGLVLSISKFRKTLD